MKVEAKQEQQNKQTKLLQRGQVPEGVWRGGGKDYKLWTLLL